MCCPFLQCVDVILGLNSLSVTPRTFASSVAVTKSHIRNAAGAKSPCFYVNQSQNDTLPELCCSEDTELLFLSLRHFYLPGEFGHLFTVVYIHLRAQAAAGVSCMCG